MKDISDLDLGLIIDNKLVMLERIVAFVGVFVFIGHYVSDRHLASILKYDGLVWVGTTLAHAMHRLEFT